MEAKIAEDLLGLAYPIDKLKLLPGNPNKGNVEAVAALYEEVGQRKPIVAKHDGENEYVVAGNTQLLAARDILGWTHIAVSWADDLDEKQTIVYALGDNKTARLGETDEEAELEMLKIVEDDYELLNAAGYDLEYIQNLEDPEPNLVEDSLGSIFDDEEDNDEPAPKPERQPGNPVIQYAIVFETEDQQQKWFAFVRWLKATNPTLDTLAARLDVFLDGIVPVED